MKEITLTPKDVGPVAVGGEAISPDRLFDKDAKAISLLPLWQGNRQVALGDLFRVDVDGRAASPAEAMVVLAAGVPRVKRVGEGMTAGEIVVKGDVDMHCGALMKGGRIVVEGDADSWLGREMEGGEIVVKGNAANYVGSGYRGEQKGMRGGVITVEGSAGDYLGERLAGGKIEVKADTGLLAGLGQQGGEILVHGAATLPGGDMVKGLLVVGKAAELLPTFKPDGTQEHGGRPHRKFIGDLAAGGEGVLLVREL